MYIATNNWEVETYKKKLEKIVKMERATVSFSRTTKVRLSLARRNHWGRQFPLPLPPKIFGRVRSETLSKKMPPPLYF